MLFCECEERQKPINEENPDPMDNLEDFNLISQESLVYYMKSVKQVSKTRKAVIVGFGGTALGNIPFVPGMGLSEPKGVPNKYCLMELLKKYAAMYLRNVKY